jgi:alkanesulfonate monooxygenase SsuD/methylene tetrahydromethanopterin reductase-like flavin-dependent oxidoreductase (luciferase family)
VQVHGDTVRFGVHSGQQCRSFPELLELWQGAERLGYDWVSLFDHLRPPLGGPAGPCFEGTTMLAALAALTNRVRCAMLVSAVTWRHPAVAAAAAATIDRVSGGRVEFGLGAGGPDLGYEQFGIPFPDHRTRLDMLDEACRVIRSLWEQEQTTFHGEHYRMRGAHLVPKPLQRRLPLIIGGAGERRMLRIVANHADIWNALAGDLSVYERKLEALARHCREVGRAPGDIRRSLTFRALLAEDEDEARRRERRFRQSVPEDWPVLAEYVVFGSPAQCVARLLPYLELGVRDFVLGARPPIDWTTIELFARDVAPALRRHAAR